MKHEHYHKNVSHLDSIDVYRVLKLYGVTDPCVQHAVKKLLCSGQRGVKTESQDVQEAIDALSRYLQMASEDDSHLLFVVHGIGDHTQRLKDIGIIITLHPRSLLVITLKIFT